MANPKIYKSSGSLTGTGNVPLTEDDIRYVYNDGRYLPYVGKQAGGGQQKLAQLDGPRILAHSQGLDAPDILNPLGQRQDTGSSTSANTRFDWDTFGLHAIYNVSALTLTRNRAYAHIFRYPYDGVLDAIRLATIYDEGDVATSNGIMAGALYTCLDPDPNALPRYWTWYKQEEFAAQPLTTGHVVWDLKALGRSKAMNPHRWGMVLFGTTALSAKMRYHRVMPVFDRWGSCAYSSGTSSHSRTIAYHYRNSAQAYLDGTTPWPNPLPGGFVTQATSSNHFSYQFPLFQGTISKAGLV